MFFYMRAQGTRRFYDNPAIAVIVMDGYLQARQVLRKKEACKEEKDGEKGCFLFIETRHFFFSSQKIRLIQVKWRRRESNPRPKTFN